MRPPCAEANACGLAAPPTREFTTRSELKHPRASLFRTRSESFQTNAELQRPLAPHQGAFSKLRTRHPEQKTPSPERNARPAARRAPRATQMARCTIKKARRAAKNPAQAKQHPDQAPKPSHEPNRRTPPARQDGAKAVCGLAPEGSRAKGMTTRSAPDPMPASRFMPRCGRAEDVGRLGAPLFEVLGLVCLNTIEPELPWRSKSVQKKHLLAALRGDSAS